MDSDKIDQFRHQGNIDPPDNFYRIMPLAVFRVTWRENGENKEAWFRTEQLATRFKIDELDHSDGAREYLNFERWYAYRENEHDVMIRHIERERGWWSPR
jgi:hypothetical protein